MRIANKRTTALAVALYLPEPELRNFAWLSAELKRIEVMDGQHPHGLFKGSGYARLR